MEKLIQARLREAGQTLFFKQICEPEKEAVERLKLGGCVIVEADRGLDYGYIVSADGPAKVEGKKQEEPVRKVVRLASSQDLKQIVDNKIKAKEAFSDCQKKIKEYKLEMKLVDCEYSLDRGKLVFYFTSESRVDFRDLVKELAKVFKARIELRQIGVRDEARFLGGYGVCGRRLCCASFLKDFEPVMIKMAKEQGLPLNPPKISGLCGRLMCCLSYEYETYLELSKGLPKEGESVTVSEGKGKVVSVNKLKRCCTLELEDGRHACKEYK